MDAISVGRAVVRYACSRCFTSSHYYCTMHVFALSPSVVDAVHRYAMIGCIMRDATAGADGTDGGRGHRARCNRLASEFNNRRKCTVCACICAQGGRCGGAADANVNITTVDMT